MDWSILMRNVTMSWDIKIWHVAMPASICIGLYRRSGQLRNVSTCRQGEVHNETYCRPSTARNSSSLRHDLSWHGVSIRIELIYVDMSYLWGMFRLVALIQLVSVSIVTSSRTEAARIVVLFCSDWKYAVIMERVIVTSIVVGDSIGWSYWYSKTC